MPGRNQTFDLQVRTLALYSLSHGHIWSQTGLGQDSNLRPLASDASALTKLRHTQIGERDGIRTHTPLIEALG